MPMGMAMPCPVSHGPWHVLCDNESFLAARDARMEYLRSKVILWHIPARSPDLNPNFRGFEMLPAQRKLYETLKKESMIEDHSFDGGAKLTKLQQIKWKRENKGGAAGSAAKQRWENAGARALAPLPCCRLCGERA